MKILKWIPVLLVLLPGCAAFKELQPDPELSRMEGGYIELKNGKDNFELDKDKKYFIKFPPPLHDRFYLVLVTQSKPLMHSYFTNTFDDGKGPFLPIIDESVSNDSISVYAIDNKSPMFYWVIDTVRQDLVLSMHYRYVPRWRYTFENKYTLYKATLADNTVDRVTYNSIDLNFNVDRFDFREIMPMLDTRSRNLNGVKSELDKLADIFPDDIAASQDTAYRNYVALKSAVDDEIRFQDDYATILGLFKKELDTRNDMPAFLESVPFFTGIMAQRDRFTPGIRAKASKVLLTRLNQVQPYFDNMLERKSNASAISPAPSVDDVSALYRACGQQIPSEIESVLRFISRFNVEAEGLRSANMKYESLRSFFNANSGAASGSFYVDLVAKAGDLKAAIPEAQTSRFPRYGSYNCAAMLSREVANASNKASDLLGMYQTAQSVSQSLAGRSWGTAERHLRELYEMRPTIDNPDFGMQQGVLVRRFENDIFEGVKTASQQRIDGFIASHSMEIDNVPQLYADSAFSPVYEISFSAAGQAELARKRKQIDDYLDGIKYNKFPESSIRNIYADFSRNPKDRGVEKARAIVEHGKFYKGNDKQVKGLITECDVDAAKWIVKAAEYRKLFALPVTSNKQGTNEYMFRIRLQIPSDAQFPVFDINLKLPEEVAEKAGQQQWFESITLDKKPLKNEGRFRITSPTALNNYEALITPVQMDKEGRNILEVRFKYPGFRVFEVSAMAQVPIIRKN